MYLAHEKSHSRMQVTEGNIILHMKIWANPPRFCVLQGLVDKSRIIFTKVIFLQGFPLFIFTLNEKFFLEVSTSMIRLVSLMNAAVPEGNIWPLLDTPLANSLCLLFNHGG